MGIDDVVSVEKNRSSVIGVSSSMAIGWRRSFVLAGSSAPLNKVGTQTHNPLPALAGLP